jgi:hypothetical protein
MSQLNMHVSEDFDRALREYMRRRRIRTKAEAIRRAVAESLERAKAEQPTIDFRAWIGAALEAPLDPNARFQTDDDLWDE